MEKYYEELSCGWRYCNTENEGEVVINVVGEVSKVHCKLKRLISVCGNLILNEVFIENLIVTENCQNSV